MNIGLLLEQVVSLLSAAKVDDLIASNPEYESGLLVLNSEDPTRNKKYLSWGLLRLKAGDDVDDIVKVMKAFEAGYSRLENKDIGSYGSLAEVMEALSVAGPTKRSVKRKGRLDAEILWEDDNWLLVHPQTQAAAVYYGTNTSWCISRREDDKNYFEKYSFENIQFYLLINKRKAKATKDTKRKGADFSKLALLFKEGRPYLSERYQDASNTKPSRAKVVAAIGSELLKLVEGVAGKHAKENPETLDLQALTASENPSTPASVLEKLAGNNSERIRRSVAENSNTPASVLEKLAGDDSDGVRKKVAENRNTSSSVLEKLSNDKDWGTRYAVSENPSTPVYVLEKLSNDKDWGTRYAVSENPSTPVYVLEKLAGDDSDGVREGVAENPNTPASVLETLAKDREWWVRENVAGNPNTPASVLEMLAGDDRYTVRADVAENPNTPASVLENLARDREWYVREKVAGNPNTPASVLENLARDREWYVREKVAGNPNTPASVLETLAKDRDATVRRAADRNPNKLLGGVLSAAKADDFKAKYPELAEGIDVVVEADPTANKKYLTWAVGLLRKGAEADGLAEAIKQYHEALPRMRAEDKQLFNLKSLEDMKAAVGRAGAAVTKGDIRQKAKKGAVVLYEDDRWQLVHPTTMDGAIRYGSNTSWCIARRDKENNYFYDYAAENNVNFYILIDKGHEAYTEEVAKRTSSYHFSKLAMLFSSGILYLRLPRPEPFQDASNRRPAKQEVVKTLGPELFDKMYEISQKHAKKHLVTWGHELLTTDDEATFNKLFEEHMAEVAYLDATEFSKQLTKFTSEETKGLSDKLLDSALSGNKVAIIRDMATNAKDEETLLKIAKKSKDETSLVRLMSRTDVFYREVAEAVLARDLTSELEAKSENSPRQVLLALMWNDLCPSDIFLSIADKFKRQSNASLLTDVINYRGRLSEVEQLWAIDEFVSGHQGQTHTDTSPEVFCDYILSSSDKISDKVADALLNKVGKLPHDLIFGRTLYDHLALKIAKFSQKLAPATLERLLNWEIEPELRRFLFGRLAGASDPEFLDKLLTRVLDQDDFRIVKETVNELISNPKLSAHSVDRIIEEFSEGVPKGAPYSLAIDVLAAAPILYRLLKIPDLSPDQARKVLRVDRKLSSRDGPASYYDAIKQLAKYNKNPETYKMLMEEGLAEKVMDPDDLVKYRIDNGDAEAVLREIEKQAAEGMLGNTFATRAMTYIFESLMYGDASDRGRLRSVVAGALASQHLVKFFDQVITDDSRLASAIHYFAEDAPDPELKRLASRIITDARSRELGS